MKLKLLALIALAGTASVSWLAFDDSAARTLPGGILEERVNANLLRIRIADRWQEVPLMPLSDQICDSDDPFFDRYCD